MVIRLCLSLISRTVKSSSYCFLINQETIRHFIYVCVCMWAHVYDTNRIASRERRWCEKKAHKVIIYTCCKEAKLQARIKPTALCSAIDKENLIEFLLDFLYYLYNYYMVCALLSHAYHMTSCDVTLWLCDTCDMTLSHTLFYVVSPR